MDSCSLDISLNGHFRILDWRYLPYIRPIFQAYVREYPHKIWPYTVQYLHFRILKFPLIPLCFRLALCWSGYIASSTLVSYDYFFGDTQSHGHVRFRKHFHQLTADMSTRQTCSPHQLLHQMSGVHQLWSKVIESLYPFLSISTSAANKCWTGRTTWSFHYSIIVTSVISRLSCVCQWKSVSALVSIHELLRPEEMISVTDGRHDFGRMDSKMTTIWLPYELAMLISLKSLISSTSQDDYRIYRRTET